MRVNILLIGSAILALSACGGGSNNWVPNESSSSLSESSVEEISSSSVNSSISSSSVDGDGSSSVTHSSFDSSSSDDEVVITPPSSVTNSSYSSDVSSTSGTDESSSQYQSSSVDSTSSISSLQSHSSSANSSSSFWSSSADNSSVSSALLSSVSSSFGQSSFSSIAESSSLSSLSQSSASSSVESSALSSLAQSSITSSEFSSAESSANSSESAIGISSSLSSIFQSSVSSNGAASSSSFESSASSTSTSLSSSSSVMSSSESSQSSSEHSSSSISSALSSSSSSLPYFNGYAPSRSYRADTNLPTYEDIVVHGTIAQKEERGIYVNGIFFNYTTAAKIINGEYSYNSELTVGDKVSMTAYLLSQTRANALYIRVNAELIGEVRSLDPHTMTIQALGQIIKTDNETLWPDKSFRSSIKVGDFVEVYGTYEDNTTIKASKVTRELNPISYITGALTQIDSGNKHMTIGNTDVNFSDYTINNPGALAEGVTMTARGPYISNQIIPDDDQLKVGDSDSTSNYPLAQVGIAIDGVITDQKFSNLVSIDSHLILLNHSTFTPGFPIIENGSVSSITPGKHVTVYGYYDDLLIPTRIVVHDEISGSRDSVIVQSSSVANATDGSVTINNVVYEVNARTLLVDNSPSPIEYFSLSSIQPGDQIDISYSTTDDGRLIALKINRVLRNP